MEHENQKRKTVGKLSYELLEKEPDSRDPIELQRSMQEDYIKELIECVQSARKSIIGSFFIEVQTKREPLLHNVLRNYFIPRKSCPTPNYDQTVFMFNCANEDISYLWTIPCRDACLYLKKHALEVVEEERAILNFVLQYSDGTLFKLCKKLNGEQLDSPLLITQGAA